MPRPTNGVDDDGNEDYVDGDGGVDENYFRASYIYIFILLLSSEVQCSLSR